MDAVKIWVEDLIGLTGLTGDLVPILRHVVLALIAILLATLAGLLCRKLLVPLVKKVTARTEARWDEVLFNERVLVSACHIVPAIVVWLLLPLVFYQFPTVRELVARATAIYITVMVVRTVFVFLGSFKDLDEGRRSSSQQYFYSFIGVLKIIMVVIATIIVVGIVINRNPLTLLAGLGATSAVLMLIFQDTIKGLVAGIRLTSNDMLHVGDWITVPKAGADGTVEEMTLTTVKIRNFDNTIITVTPQTLVDDSFQNWIGMQEGEGRRVNRAVYYDFRQIRRIDAELRQQLVDKGYFKETDIKVGDVNMTLYRRYMEQYLRSHPLVNPNMTLMVRQLDATQSGLPVEFYFFLKEKSWEAYEQQLAEILDYIYAVTPDFGLLVYEHFPEQQGN
ncbi:MAG: mechanosensitive ion channel family protein [Prevotella sp.]|nr:mechanosensitive ion channel family protein [Prevotella sp.]